MRRTASEPPPTGRSSLVGRRGGGALVLAGCGGNSSSADTADAGAGPCGTTDHTTVTVGLFGTFGFKETGLWDAYKKVCPNITIKEDVVEQSADYWTRLKTRLAVGQRARRRPGDRDRLRRRRRAEPRRPVRQLEHRAERRRRTRRSSTPGSGSWRRPATARTPSVSAPTSARRRSATAATCSKQAGLPSDPADPGLEVDHVGRLHQLRQAVRGVEDQAVRLALRRQRGEHLLDRRLPGRQGVRQRRRRDRRREQRRRPDRVGLRHARRRRTASPPGCSSSPRRGTRRSPAARSPRSPAPPG